MSSSAEEIEIVSVTGYVSKVTRYDDQSGFFMVRLVSDKMGRLGVKGLSVFPPESGLVMKAVGQLSVHEQYGTSIDVGVRGAQLEMQAPNDYEARVAYYSKLCPNLSHEEAKIAARSRIDIEKDVVPGIDPEHASMFRTAVQLRVASSKALTSVRDMGFGASAAVAAVRYFSLRNENAHQVALANPYRLLSSGARFGSVDKVALKHGWSYESPERIVAGLGEAARRSNSDGSTVLTEHDIVVKAARVLSPDHDDSHQTHEAPTAARIREILPQAVAEGVVIFRDLESGERFQSPRMNDAEKTLAAQVVRHSRVRTHTAIPTREFIEDRYGFKPDEDQMRAITMPYENGLSLVIGGPGCGKTFSFKATAGFWPGEVHLFAPTGMAAMRLMQATGYRAGTMHKALGAQFSSGGMRFRYHSRNPMPIAEGSLIGIDETTLAGTETTAAFFQALPPKSTVVLLGDPDQLPSVEAGSVLADLLQSSVPSVRLRYIHRTGEDSPIPLAAADLIAGRVPSIPDGRKETASTLRHIESRDPQSAAEVAMVARGMVKAGVSCDDVMVLSPRREGFFGQYSLNEDLQKVWNPEPKGDALRVEFEWNNTAYHQKLFLGDRVMATEGRYGNSDIYNGMTFEVVGVGHEKIHLRPLGADQHPELYDPTESIITLEGEKNYGHLRLAYAKSIHQAQGSESKYVIMALSEQEHRDMLGRRLVYTGMTRAKSGLTIVGQREALVLAAHDVGNMRIRESGLREYLETERSPRLRMRAL